MPNWKKIITSGSDAALNSLVVTNGITGSLSGSVTGSLFGTSSFALTASLVNTASFAQTASFVNPLRQNVQVTGALLLTQSYIAQVDYFDFNTGSATPAWKSGRMYWNNVDGCLDVYNAEQAITLQVGQENWTRVRNNTGTTITNGTVVRLLGSQGDAPTIERAQSLAMSGSVNTQNQILGVATHDIEDNSFGYVTTQGLVRGLNTNAFNDGDTLFVGTGSSGILQNTAPRAPYEIIPVGVCVKASPGGSGVIYVAVQEPIDFSDLSSVLVEGTYHYGDLWTYVPSGSFGVWKHTNQLSGSYGLTGSLDATSFTGSLQGTASWALNVVGGGGAQNLQSVISVGNQTSESINITGSFTNGFQVLSLSGSYSHAEGYLTTAIGYTSHAEGLQTISTGSYSHAEGTQTTSIGDYSHAEGYLTTAVGNGTHAEGEYTTTINIGAHAEGQYTTAGGAYSHTEGNQTITDNSYQHAEGIGTIATTKQGQHVEGQYNIQDPNAIWIVGDGFDDGFGNITRSNLIAAYTDILTVTGSVRIRGGITGSSYTGSFTGSFLGTSSFALTALTSSFAISSSRAVSSSFALTASLLLGSIQSASFASTASFLNPGATASLALTASFLSGSVTSASFASTASFLNPGATASFALTASFVNPLRQNVLVTGSLRVSGSTVITGSVSATSFTGSLLGTASYALQALSSSYALTASYALNGGGGGGVTINNNTDNYLLTATGTSNTINGEANLTFNGTTLYVNGALGVGTDTPTTTGLIRATNDVVAFYSSDERLKENKTPIEGSLDKVNQLSGYEFDWIPMKGIHENEGHDIGVIAQEVEKVFPEIVTTRDNGYKAVKYEKLTAVLIEAVKELTAKVEDLQNQINDLKK